MSTTSAPPHPFLEPAFRQRLIAKRMSTTSTPFNHRLRHKISKRLSKMPFPVMEDLQLLLDTQLLLTPSVEYLFSRPPVHPVALLQPNRTFYLPHQKMVLPVAVTQNVSLPERTETFDATSVLQELPTVSGNLFQPLGKPQIGGKDYGHATRRSQQTLFSDFGIDTEKSNRVDGYRKSFTETKTSRTLTSRKVPNLWDLVLPLLQPPVDYAFVDVLDLPPRCAPYPYQWKGIKFLIERQSALLGDDMGTGKTVQSILACRLLFQRGSIQKTLIVSPLSVLTQWDRELQKWAPSLTVTVVRGNVEHREVCWTMPAHIWLTTYETLRQDIDFLVSNQKHSFDLAILDEAQRIKNRSAGISQAVRQLKTRYQWALTGTPIENRIEELASIFSFLRAGLFPSEDVQPYHAKELIKPFFLRRKREDVLKDLPEKEEFPVRLRLSEQQQETYNKMERERVVELHRQDTAITAHNIVTLIGELKKICNRDPDSGQSAKLDWLLETIPGVCDSGDKVLIFTQYRQEQFGGTNWLEKELTEYGTLNYGHADTDRKRQYLLRAFETDPKYKILVANPRTAGVGLNQLVAANYVVHFDHWWNPAVTNQATARAHRPGQTKKVFVYHLWVEETIEELILQKTMAKQRLYDEVIDSLSSGISEEVLFEIYDDLLTKHGFQPLHLGKKVQTSESAKAPARYSATVTSPQEFERLVGRLFQVMGFSTRVTPYSRDGGVDVIATRELGASVERLAIQCKFQTGSVGRPVLQQLLGVLASDPSLTKGILVTTGDVSKDAMELARQNGRLQIVAGRDLEALLQKYQVQ